MLRRLGRHQYPPPFYYWYTHMGEASTDSWEELTHQLQLRGTLYQGMIFRRPFFFFLLEGSFFLEFFLSVGSEEPEESLAGLVAAADCVPEAFAALPVDAPFEPADALLDAEGALEVEGETETPLGEVPSAGAEAELGAEPGGTVSTVTEEPVEGAPAGLVVAAVVAPPVPPPAAIVEVPWG